MRVLITGSGGMLGTALRRSWARLRSDDQVIAVTRHDADLRDRQAVLDLVAREQPDLVVHAAARVGGIAANLAAPTEFLLDNLRMDSNVIEAAASAGVSDFVYVGSSCMYPKDYRQPLVESDLLAAPLEPSNEGYALAKIAGAKLCNYVSMQHGLNYRTIVPSNLYGPGDHFGEQSSHLIAATLHKAHTAKTQQSPSILVWGDGSARREFTYVEDVSHWLANSVHTIEDWPDILNIGLGTDYSVREFHEIALDVVGYECELAFDTTRPVGMQQKLMDSSAAQEFGWNPETDLRSGMAQAYAAYLEE